MSRLNDGTRVPMSVQRRESIIKEFVEATGCIASFPSEVIQITIVRIDREVSELIAVLEMDERGVHVHAGYSPTPVPPEEEGARK